MAGRTRSTPSPSAVDGHRRKSTKPKLRIGVTIAGAASLGAYEGGALAALLVAVQQMNGAVVVDAVTGASSGAITAVLTARCLLRGIEPVEAMVRSWVDLPDLSKLASRRLNSPLDADVLDEGARRLLAGPCELPDGPLRQREDVHVSLALASLGGFGYRIKALEHQTPVQAVTYRDWADFHFTPRAVDDVYEVAADAALASAANAVGFPPRLVRRSEADIDRYVANGVLNPPSPEGAWYTDGGTVDNEPFGRLLDLIGRHCAENGEPRLLLLVHPHPTQLPGRDLWEDSEEQPRWTRTALRAERLQRTQSIYDDLRRLEKTNTHLLSMESLVGQIDEAVGPTRNPSARQDVAAALRTVLLRLEDERLARDEDLGRETPTTRAGHPRLTATGSDDIAELLRSAIAEATGLRGKRPVKVEIVSPALDTSGRSPEELLAGERLGHFFGFIDRRYRQNDFLVGYRNMQTFLADTLGDYGVGDEVKEALPVVDARVEALRWPHPDLGAADVKDLSLVQKTRLVCLGVHVARIVWNDVRHWDAGLPVNVAGQILGAAGSTVRRAVRLVTGQPS